MQTIDQLLAEAPAFEGMSEAHLRLIAGCAQNRVFEDGEYLMRQGDAADTFYVIRYGRVALELFVPQRGAVTIETIDDGDLLGWSWLVSPFRVEMDARAFGTVHTVAFDATCLRDKSDTDPVLGYELMRRFIPVIVERLQATRVRLLDVYGHVAS
ncbi:MAG TPA: cyclic nucleotide-binding domain-containing protein [Solirubrobacterales bacterium]|nr:cyclic nucleotide-binding domain-containing protein [Solirubrobacterales bacterium]